MNTFQGASEADFGRIAEQHRHELRVHCYRMLGSVQDAEDLVQETFLRAWQKLNTFEGRGTFRSWLYTIATNACLDAMDRRPARTLPVLHREAADPSEAPEPPTSESMWIEPIPDELVGDIDAGPEAYYTARESITFAFLAALQYLPPRQRAVLIFSDVLDWEASQVAEALGMTSSAVNSALHRARETLTKHYGSEGKHKTPKRIPDDEIVRLLDRYVKAWENADLEALVALLKEDAAFTMPPSPSWYLGTEAIRTFLAHKVLAGDARGRYRFVHTRANGHPAFGWYQRDERGERYQGFAVQVLTLDGGSIAEVMTFMKPELFAQFGLPLELKKIE